MKNIGMVITKLLPPILAGILALASAPVMADNTNQQISNLANASNGGSNGQSTIQLNVLQGVAQGNASPVEQYILTNTIFNSCANGVVNNMIGMQDSYQTATTKFQQDICSMYNCYQQAMLISMLATGSNNSSNGGQSDQTSQCQSQQNIRNFLATAQGNQNCPGSFPPELLQVIAQPNNGSCN